MRRHSRRLAAFGLAIGLGLTGCAGEDGESGDDTPGVSENENEHGGEHENEDESDGDDDGS